MAVNEIPRLEQKVYLPSTSIVTGYSKTTDQILFIGSANTSNMFDMTMTSTEVRGGEGSQLLFDYYSGRSVTFEAMSVSTKYEYLALKAGRNLTSGTQSIQEIECLTLDASGQGTLDFTPTANTDVVIFNIDTGTRVEVTPSTNTITYLPFADATVSVVYFTDKNVDEIIVDSSTAPQQIRLVFTSKQYNEDGAVNGKYQIEIPNAQLDGDFDFSHTADGVLQTKLSGKAIVSTSGCNQVYAIVSVDTLDVELFPVESIDPVFELNDTDSLDIASPGTDTDYNIIVTGFRGAIAGSRVVTTECSYAVETGGSAGITVNASTGVVTVASTVTTGDSAQIAVSLTGVNDRHVTVNIT